MVIVCLLLLCQSHPQQVFFHNLVLLGEEFVDIPGNVNVAPGEPFLSFLCQIHDGVGC